LLKIHASRFSFSARARADDEIVRARDDRVNQTIHQLRAVASVAVEKDDDLAGGRDGLDARPTRTPVTASQFADHARSGLTRPLSRAVVASVIDDDHFARDLARDGAHNIANRLFFVQSRDHNGDESVRFNLIGHVRINRSGV
jgi:hypothetical protein